MRSRTLAAAALTAALALAGCSGGDPEPEFEPETSSAASTTKASEPTTEPSPTQPAMGPVQTVRAWFAALSAAVESGDTRDVEELTWTECETCFAQIEPITEVYQKGGQFNTDGPAWRVVRAKQDSLAGDTAKVSVALKLSSGVTTPSKGAEPVPYPVEHRIAQVELVREAGRWRLSFLGFLS